MSENNTLLIDAPLVPDPDAEQEMGPDDAEAFETLHQLGARTLPLKGVGRSVRECFVEAQPLFDFLKMGKVGGCEDLAVHDREVDRHLVEPAGLDRRVHHTEIGIGRGQPAHRRLPPVRRAVIEFSLWLINV